MLSIASLMSSTSNLNTNNPYLNSNVIFEKNLNSYLHKSNESNSVSEHLNNKSEEVSGVSGSKFNFTDEEIPDEDNIDFYLKLHAKQSETNKEFDSISQVFKNSTNLNQVENNFSIENAIDNDMKIIKVKNKSTDSNNNTITSNNNKNKLVTSSSSSSSLNSKNQTVKSDEEKTLSSSSLNKKTSSNLKHNDTLIESKNPFLNDHHQEENNPFLNHQDKNPFLTDNKNESISQKTSNESAQNLSTILNASKDSISNSLLDWCNEIIRKSGSNHRLFNKLIVNDFSTSWINGLAFCAILYHFSPNLIDLNSLDESDCRKNLKQAFNASDKESIMRVVDVCDFINKKKIDELSIMTYLYQIKNHFDSFSNKKQQAPQRPTSILSEETSKVFAAKLATLPNLISTPMSNKIPHNKSQNNSTKSAKTPVKSICSSSTNNPFESDAEEENLNNNNSNNNNYNDYKKKSGLIEIKSNGKIVDACLSNNFNEPFCDDILDNLHSRRSTSRRNSLHSRSGSSSSTSSINSANQNGSHHNGLLIREKKSVNENTNSSNNQKVITPNKSEELIERAKQLIEKTKNENENSAAKREEIKQLAKQMIADTKKKRKSSIPNSITKNYPAPKPPVDSNNSSSNNTQQNSDNKSDNLNTTSDIVNSIQQSLEEQTQNQLIGTEYINQEIINLRNKQLELDEQGGNLEKQLRILMKDKKSDQDRELEDILLKKWFLLINEKNKLIYQQQELETL
jgi:hypothetical protein